jgi:hypothetical protein
VTAAGLRAARAGEARDTRRRDRLALWIGWWPVRVARLSGAGVVVRVAEPVLAALAPRLAPAGDLRWKLPGQRLACG